MEESSARVASRQRRHPVSVMSNDTAHGCDGDGRDAQRSHQDDRAHDGQSEGRLARLRHVRGGVQHQQLAAALERRDLLGRTLDEEDVAGPQAFVAQLPATSPFPADVPWIDGWRAG